VSNKKISWQEVEGEVVMLLRDHFQINRPAAFVADSVVGALEHIYESAENDKVHHHVLITGSLYLVGNALNHLKIPMA
jgi:folylpolyglutamate synthase/dihydropteroate synthase